MLDVYLGTFRGMSRDFPTIFCLGMQLLFMWSSLRAVQKHVSEFVLAFCRGILWEVFNGVGMMRLEGVSPFFVFVVFLRFSFLFFIVFLHFSSFKSKQLQFTGKWGISL